MSFDFSTLITDRQKSDADYARALIGRIAAGTATAEELAEWNAATLKGVYDYTDLNRVTAAMDEINRMLSAAGYKTGYQPSDVSSEDEGKLPEGYIKLSFIESNGTQYIKTQIYPSNNLRIAGEISCPLPLNKTSWIFGGRTSTDANAIGIFWWTNTNTWSADYSSNEQRKNFSNGIKSDSLLSFDFDKNSLSINSEKVTFMEESFKSSSQIVLFAVNTNGTISSNISCQMYKFKIYENGNLVRDYVPCKNPSGIIGLYDLITNQFYGNDGNGNFIAGEEIIDNPVLKDYKWYESDSPTLFQLTQYLGSVRALRSAIVNQSPEVPGINDLFSVEAANNIEKILLSVEYAIQTMKQTYVPCGATACGGDYL